MQRDLNKPTYLSTNENNENQNILNEIDRIDRLTEAQYALERRRPSSKISQTPKTVEEEKPE